jgi:hypothetical protein
MKKFRCEKGSAESKQPKGILPSAVMELARAPAHHFSRNYRHRLERSIPRDGTKQQVGTGRRQHVSEWRRILGLVLTTKRWLEVDSKER